MPEAETTAITGQGLNIRALAPKPAITISAPTSLPDALPVGQSRNNGVTSSTERAAKRRRIACQQCRQSKVLPQPKTSQSSVRRIGSHTVSKAVDLPTDFSRQLRCEGSRGGIRRCNRCQELDRPCILDAEFKRVTKQTYASGGTPSHVAKLHSTEHSASLSIKSNSFKLPVASTLATIFRT